MNLLAAAMQTQPAPAYQNPGYQGQGYQNTTMQPDKPVQQPNWKAKVFGYGFLLFHIAFWVFIIVMVYRFVRAHEKIAGSHEKITGSLDKGIIIRKDDTTT